MSNSKTMIDVFSNLLGCVGAIALWHYDKDMRLLSSNCMDEELADMLFTKGGGKQLAANFCTSPTVPSIIMDSTGVCWIAAPQKVNTVLQSVFVIGPVLCYNTTESNIMKRVKNIQIHAKSRADLVKMIKNLPVIQHTVFMQYGAMLHYCVTKAKITAADVKVVNPHPLTQKLKEQGRFDVSRHGIRYGFAEETTILNAIETGNIEFNLQAKNKRSGLLSKDDPLRQVKNEMIVFITLQTRAALRSGLPEETSYALNDRYIQMVEAEEEIPAIYKIGTESFHDFTRRVHNYLLAGGRSRGIMACIAYIENHITEKINFDKLAKHLGYTRNHLSSKFKKEMGITLNSYIINKKLEMAKVWLNNSRKDILDICLDLNFGSASYFGSLFRKYTGLSPSEYRGNGREITEH